MQIKALFTPFFIFLIESLISCQEKQYQQGKCAHAVSGRGQGSGLKPQKDYSLCVFSASEHMHLSLSSFIALPQLTKLFALIITRYLFLPPFCSSFEHRFPTLSGKKKKISFPVKQTVGRYHSHIGLNLTWDKCFDWEPDFLFASQWPALHNSTPSPWVWF